jgi:hypothetical protein
MIRVKLKWRPHKIESTDARHRGGAARSSDEVSVMGMERRGCIDRLLMLPALRVSSGSRNLIGASHSLEFVRKRLSLG